MDDLGFVVLEDMKVINVQYRRIKDNKWINRLNTVYEGARV